jgi:hypothetical protein
MGRQEAEFVLCEIQDILLHSFLDIPGSVEARVMRCGKQLLTFYFLFLYSSRSNYRARDHTTGYRMRQKIKTNVPTIHWN